MTTILEVIEHPDFISLRAYSTHYVAEMKSTIDADGGYYDYTGTNKIDGKTYFLEISREDIKEDLSEDSAYLNKYLSIGNQQEDEDGEH